MLLLFDVVIIDFYWHVFNLPDFSYVLQSKVLFIYLL
jgi:hypothetical protein